VENAQKGTQAEISRIVWNSIHPLLTSMQKCVVDTNRNYTDNHTLLANHKAVAVLDVEREETRDKVKYLLHKVDDLCAESMATALENFINWDETLTVYDICTNHSLVEEYKQKSSNLSHYILNYKLNIYKLGLSSVLTLIKNQTNLALLTGFISVIVVVIQVRGDYKEDQRRQQETLVHQKEALEQQKYVEQARRIEAENRTVRDAIKEQQLAYRTIDHALLHVRNVRRNIITLCKLNPQLAADRVFIQENTIKRNDASFNLMYSMTFAYANFSESIYRRIDQYIDYDWSFTIEDICSGKSSSATYQRYTTELKEAMEKEIKSSIQKLK
jgi:hypothetical protein